METTGGIMQEQDQTLQIQEPVEEHTIPEIVDDVLAGKVKLYHETFRLFLYCRYLSGYLSPACRYYMIPGIYHPFISYSDGGLILMDPAKMPRFVYSAHHIYTAGFFVLTLNLCVSRISIQK